MSSREDLTKPAGSISEDDLKKLLQYIDSVHYGSVTLIIQDGKIVQIEKSEKIKIK